MKAHYLCWLLSVLVLFGCDECINDDCPAAEETVTIQVLGDWGVSYRDSLRFYYYNEQQQKIEAEIERNRVVSQQYYVHVGYTLKTGRYYLELGDQIKTVDIEVEKVSGDCCEYQRFGEVRVDGQLTTLPLEIAAD